MSPENGATTSAITVGGSLMGHLSESYCSSMIFCAPTGLICRASRFSPAVLNNHAFWGSENPRSVAPALVQEDLIDQLFNSCEKRLARALLLLANFGKRSTPETVVPISQVVSAEMVGTTRSRINFFYESLPETGGSFTTTAGYRFTTLS
jgi:hypothetical protein